MPLESSVEVKEIGGVLHQRIDGGEWVPVPRHLRLVPTFEGDDDGLLPM